MLVTELTGALRVIRNGKLVAAPVKTCPKALMAAKAG